MKYIYAVLLVFCFVNINAQSIYEVGGDTMVCLTNTETKIVLEKLHDRIRLMQKDSIQQLVIKNQDSTISNLSQQIEIQKQVSDIKEETIIVLKGNLEAERQANDKLNKQIKKDRRIKTFLSIGTGVLSGILIALLI